MSAIIIDKDTIAECAECGELRTHEADERLCSECLEAAELVNSHNDGNHDDYAYFDPKCRACNNGDLSAAGRKRADEPSYEERQAARGDWLRQVRKEEGDR